MTTNSDRNVGSDECVVGDLTSDAAGSGARKNAGKEQMDLIPIRYWVRHWQKAELSTELVEQKAYSALKALHRWQEGSTSDLHYYFGSQAPQDMVATVAVLEFGAKKYKAWNWAKGMAWSVPTGCALRHIKAILDKKELIDPDSGLPHYAHVQCNIMMLAYYADNYPAGDDRPPMLTTENTI